MANVHAVFTIQWTTTSLRIATVQMRVLSEKSEASAQPSGKHSITITTVLMISVNRSSIESESTKDVMIVNSISNVYDMSRAYRCVRGVY